MLRFFFIYKLFTEIFYMCQIVIIFNNFLILRQFILTIVIIMPRDAKKGQSFLKWAYDHSNPADPKYKTLSHQLYITLTGIAICLTSCYLGVKYIIPSGSEHDKQHWQVEPGSQFVGAFLLLYLIFMVLTKIHDYTRVSIYEALWACNLCLLMVGISLILGCSAVVRASMIVITCDQIPWYVDIISFILTRKFPVGVAKYLTWPQTTKLRIASTLHHLWFLPLGMWTVATSSPGFTFDVYVLSVLLVITMGTIGRISAPKAIIIKQATKDHESEEMYFNLNQAWEFWKDVKITLFDYLYKVCPGPLVIVILSFCWNTANFPGFLILKYIQYIYA